MNEKRKEIFFKLFKEVMDVDEIDMGYTLKNLPQWDSLRTVELIIEIENTFHIKLNRNQLPNMNSIANILEILDEHFKK